MEEDVNYTRVCVWCVCVRARNVIKYPNDSIRTAIIVASLPLVGRGIRAHKTTSLLLLLCEVVANGLTKSRAAALASTSSSRFVQDTRVLLAAAHTTRLYYTVGTCADLFCATAVVGAVRRVLITDEAIRDILVQHTHAIPLFCIFVLTAFRFNTRV